MLTYYTSRDVVPVLHSADVMHIFVVVIFQKYSILFVWK